MRRAVPKILLFFFKHDVVCNALFHVHRFFVFIFKHVYVYVKLMKYILLCPSDIYSMIQSLQTGMNKNIVDPYQTAPKREGSLIDYS